MALVYRERDGGGQHSAFRSNRIQIHKAKDAGLRAFGEAISSAGTAERVHLPHMFLAHGATVQQFREQMTRFARGVMPAFG